MYKRQPTAIYTEGKLYGKWKNIKTNPAYLQFMALNKAPQLHSLQEWYLNSSLDETYSTVLKRNGLTDKEIALANISANYNDIRKTSSINAYHSNAFRKFNGSKKILNFKEGTSNFINTIANKLAKPILKNKIVIGINDTHQKIKVTCADGSSYQAKKVVSTLPFTTLRDVKMNTTFSSYQKKAIQQLQYTNITQIHLAHTAPYWEQDQMPIDMWTDTPIERVMNLSSLQNEKQIACWVNGKGTAFFDKMSEKEIAHYTLQKLKEIRPASEGKITYLGTQNWGKYPFNKGAYVEFGVGQAAWFQEMVQPAGNMHFAGEHTAHKSRGMEGAAESAKRVYNELIT